MPTPVRRNGSTPKSSNTATKSTTMTGSVSASSSPLSALLPTRYEAILLLIYPATLVLGSLFSVLDPSARAAPYSAAIQSHPPAQAPAYFAKKSNILNVYFVKVAWFWISLAFFVFLFSASSLTGPGTPRGTLTPKRLRAIGRWTLVTGWWFFVTQWFFGPALIDRGFRVTGGVCELASALEGQGGKQELFTSRACKSIGGVWKGGHDISGHVFILVLGSAFLTLEILPVLAGWKEDREVITRSGIMGTAESQNGVDEKDEESSDYGRWPLLVVIGLSWWMLLMTAAYFHTWFEKLTGLLVALMGIFVVYFLPRLFPGVREVVGMPGV